MTEHQHPYPPSQPPYPPSQPPAYPPVAPTAPPAISAAAVDPRARTAGIALLVCAGVLLISLVSHSWFTGGGGSIGLLGVEECRGSGCRSMMWFDIPRAPSELKLFSTLGLLGGFASLALLIHSGVMLLKGRPLSIKLKLVNGVLGLAAFGTCSFWFHLTFGEMSRKLSMSWGGIAAMAAIISAGVILPKMVKPLISAAPPAPGPAPGAPYLPPPT